MKTIVKSLVVAAAGSIATNVYHVGKQYLMRKYTTSFSISRKDSAYAYSLIVKWLIDEKIITVERHCKIGSFVDDNTGELSISVPPDGSYYGKYKSVFVCITFSSIDQTEYGYSRKKDSDSLIQIYALNDKTNSVVSKIKCILEFQYGKDLLKIDEERTGRYVLKSKRDIDSIVMDPDIKNLLIKHLNWWRDSKQLYSKHGITYKTGILLEGPPGTGKTSLAQAIASYLDFTLLSISAGSLGGFQHCIKRNMVILIEDIDREVVRAAYRNKDRSLDNTVTSNDDFPSNYTENDFKESDLANALNTAILGPLMNTLDGVASPEGIVFILSTNHPERLDPALIRSGRIDLRLFMDYFNSERAVELGNLFNVSKEKTLALGEEVWKEPARLQLELMQMNKEIADA